MVLRVCMASLIKDYRGRRRPDEWRPARGAFRLRISCAPGDTDVRSFRHLSGDGKLEYLTSIAATLTFLSPTTAPATAALAKARNSLRCPQMDLAVATVASGLREGGLLLIRDYAVGDGAQLRLQRAQARRPTCQGPWVVAQWGASCHAPRTLHVACAQPPQEWRAPAPYDAPGPHLDHPDP